MTTWVCATCGPVPAGEIRHLDHNSPHGHERHECGSSAGLDWTKTKEHDMSTSTAPLPTEDLRGLFERTRDLIDEQATLNGDGRLLLDIMLPHAFDVLDHAAINEPRVLADPIDAAHYLRDARHRQGFNQHDLALAAGNSQSGVSDWERTGGIELSSFMRWAAALGYHVALVPMPEPTQP